MSCYLNLKKIVFVATSVVFIFVFYTPDRNLQFCAHFWAKIILITLI